MTERDSGLSVSRRQTGYAGAPGPVADELAALARQGASGALQISGDPGGTIYLSEGYLAFAESAAAPDLESRLVNSRRLMADQWSRAQQDSQPDGCAGDLLLRRGLIDIAEWQALLRSAVLDALLALALQLAGDPLAAGTSFEPRQAPCARPVLRINTGSAWAYAWQEAGRLAEYEIVPDARPRWCGPDRPWPAFGREAMVVLGQLNGHATVRELAWRNGLALYGVMDWVTRLIQDGVCIATGPARYPATTRNQDQDQLLPDRPAGTEAPAGPGGGTWHHPGGARIRWAPPSPALLQHVLAGLKRLA
jgi:hypothetical protein